MNNIDNTKVLLTFAGNSDPTRGCYDGPIIHICRHHRPSKIYLILTKEMRQRNEEPYNIYKRAIYKNIQNYEPEIISINTDIQDAHKFEVYFDVVYKTFERIKQENQDIQVLVNMTSGTTQMATNLVTYIVDATDLKIIPVQVETHERASNKAKVVDLGYNVELEAETNLDNHEETTNRLISPDLTRYSRIFAKNQIEKLLQRYDYTTTLEILKRNIFENTQEINTLLNLAIDRKNLKGVETNKKITGLPKNKYDELYYYKKNETKIPRWYILVDYFSLALIKDVSDYILMIEPITINLYLSILEEILKKPLKTLFDEEKFNRATSKLDIYYKTKRANLPEELIRKIESETNIKEFRDGYYVSDKLLSTMIKYYLEKDEKSSNKIDIKDFISLSETLDKVKNVRNMLAHSLKSITEKDFKEETNVEISKITSQIKKFLKNYYKDLGYKENMLKLYDDINQKIISLLEKEK